MVFDEILPSAFPLMVDTFGNYVIQKLFSVGDEDQVAALASKMEHRVFDLAMQIFGCRVSMHNLRDYSSQWSRLYRSPLMRFRPPSEKPL